jgi:hypothetical protein
LTGKSAGRTGGAKGRQSLDKGLDETLLAEASMADSRKGSNDESLGLHNYGVLKETQQNIRPAKRSVITKKTKVYKKECD